MMDPELYQAIFQNSPDILIHYDSTLCHVDANRASELLTQQPPENLIGKPLNHIDLDRELVSRLAPALERSLLRGQIESFELRRIFDNSVHYFECTTTPYLDDLNRVLGVTLRARDMTPYVHAQRAMREGENRFRAAAEANVNAFYLLKAVRNAENIIIDFEFVYVNQRAEKDLQTPREQLLGGRLCELFPVHQHYGYFDQYTQVLETGSSLEQEYQLAPDLPNAAWYYQQVVPLNDGVAVSNMNINLRKKYEQALIDTNRRYNILVENVPGMVYRLRMDPNGETKYEYVSQRCYELTGHTAQEIYEQPQLIVDQIHPDDLFHFLRLLRESYEDLTPLLWEGRKIVQDQIRWHREEARPIRLDDGSVIWLGILIDTTPQRQAENALRDSEEKFRLAVENIPVALVIYDETGRYLYINKRGCELAGYDRSVMLGKRDDEIQPPPVTDLYLPLLKRTMQTREPQQEQLELIQKQRTRLIKVMCVPLLDESGELRQIITIGEDVTEQRRIEGERLERETLRIALTKQEELTHLKNKMMERLAHEFRTPLSVIYTSAELLERYRERMPPEKRDGHFKRIYYEVNHLTHMLDEIAFVLHGRISRQQWRPGPYDLCALSVDVVQRLQVGQEYENRIDFHCYTPELNVYGDRSMVEILLHHLLTNALKFSPTDSLVTLMVYPEATVVCIEIIDQGIGIIDSEREQIFEPFFRGSNHHHEISGMGIGLSIVRDVVNLHHGKIELDAGPQGGSRVLVRLPLVHDDER